MSEFMDKNYHSLGPFFFMVRSPEVSKKTCMDC